MTEIRHRDPYGTAEVTTMSDNEQSPPEREGVPRIPSSLVMTMSDGMALAEASCIGLAPGQVPREIEVVSPGGRVESFAYAAPVREGGEVAAWRYASGSGSGLTVLND